MLTEREVISRLFHGYWQGASMFQRQVNGLFWQHAAEDICSESSIRLSLLTIGVPQLLEAFSPVLPDLYKLAAKPDDGAALRKAVCARLVKQLRPHRRMGQHIAGTVHGMACLHLSKNCLHPLVQAGEFVQVEGTLKIPAKDLLIRRGKTLWSFDIIDKTLAGPPVLFSGDFDEIEGFLRISASVQ